MYRIPIFLAFLLPGAAIAQSASDNFVTASPRTMETTPGGAITTEATNADVDERGLQSYVDFSGNSNSIGHMFTWGFGLGYQFNRQVSVDSPLHATGASSLDRSTSQFAQGLPFPVDAANKSTASAR